MGKILPKIGYYYSDGEYLLVSNLQDLKPNYHFICEANDPERDSKVSKYMRLEIRLPDYNPDLSLNREREK